ncbi:MAG: cyclodeaminase/cyclohydrolase family protein, partial [Thermoplasmata archaeon]|nr:cyclodeaminase/cyclohydrolase family protein [Thermoplasmata archaeon]
ASARVPERSDLAFVRRGQFEGIRDTIGSDPARTPDFGEPKVHPSAGAVAIGARPVLIAYNVYLDTPDVAIAKKIAKAVRARDGGLPEVKALGFEIKERNRAQVSMNLTDYHRTSVSKAFESVRAEAQKLGAGTEESEIVGLVPEDALFEAAESFLQLRSFDRRQILERRLAAASSGGALASLGLSEFSQRLADRTPTPGGGSASAAAAAMGAALGEMVLRYSQDPARPDAELAAGIEELTSARRALLTGVDDDTNAFESLRAARRAVKSAPDDGAARQQLASATLRATQVPLDTARTARAAARLLGRLRPKVKPTIASDAETALALLGAAVTGALANVTINLPDLEKTGGDVRSLREEADALARG